MKYPIIRQKAALFFFTCTLISVAAISICIQPLRALAATGLVQFSSASQYQFGTAGSYLSDGNTYAKIFDGDVTTWWDAPSANGGYAGLDLTVPAQVTNVLIAPRTSYTIRLPGTLIQGATTSSSTGPWTTIYTVPSYPPFYSQNQLNDIPINTGGAYYRYYRILPPNGNYGSIAELRFIGVASSTTPYVPVVPVVYPLGGKFAQPINVTITSSTTDATIYYTTDGTTPTFSGGSPQGTTQLYSGPFLATTTATTTVKAIAVSAGTYVSDVSVPAYFNIGAGFAPAVTWYDTSGRFIEGHDGSISFLNGKYYWYGENLNNSNIETELIGVQAYSSPDLLNWKNEGLVFSTAQAYKIRRPHVIYNATSSLYVMWARNATSGRIVIATSSSPTGIFTASTTTYNTPSGYGNNDIDLFQDNDGSAYLTFVSNDGTKVVVYKLASDYMSVTGSADIPPSTPANRDAPSMFRRGNVYFLVTSGQNGWLSTTVQYATTTNPLGTWSALSNPFQVSGSADYTTGYNSIVSNVIHLNGRSDGYIYTGEQYNATTSTTGSLYYSKFVWLPITFPTTNTMSVAWQNPWNLDTAFSATTLPQVATGISVVKTSSSQADVSWTNNESNAYALYIDRASDSLFTQNFSSQPLYSYTSGTAATTYSDKTVSSGNVYYYRIRTVTGAGTSYSATGIANYSLAADVTPPTVSLLAPAPYAAIIGKNVLLSASSTDDIGIASVSFYVNSTFVGTSTSTTTPNNFTWNSTGVSDGTYSLVAVAKDGSGNTATSSAITIYVENNVPLLYTSTSTVIQTSTTTITLTGNATTWTSGTPGSPTFTVTGGSGASIVSQSVASSTQATITLAAGKATSTLLITDPASGATTTIAVAADTSSPSETLNSPTNGATLTGTTTLAASSSDNVAVATLKFVLDSTTVLGPVSTSSSYSYIWDTTGTTNGTHTIVAVSSDFAGNISTSTPATVTVNNATLPGVFTATSTSVSYFSAIFNGSITSDGGASSTVRGFAYGLTTSYTASSSQSGTFGIGAFSTTTTGLSCATTYHYAAFAINLTGTKYGSDSAFSTPTCPVATSTGEIEFSVATPYQFGLTPSYLNSGNVPANVFDGNTSTWWDTSAANGAYVGLDLTVPAQVTRFRIAPRPGYTVRVYGGVLQGGATSSAAGPWTTIYTIPSYPPYYAQRQLNEIPVSTGGSSYRYYRFVMPNGANGNLAEFRLIGLPGTTTPYVPVTPTITPNGGRFDLPMKVRINSLTTDATFYYTTDGTTPTFYNGSPQGTTQLYNGPFVVSGAGTTTVQAIAVSKNQYVSEVSTQAQFYIDTSMKPAQDWLDTTGHLIESHDGNVGYFNGKYYWYGQIFNANDPENEAVGISCYSSPDLINWTDEGPIIYLGRAAVVERPHVIYNSSTGKYVMWAHNIITYPNSRAYIAYSNTPSGPFTVATTTLDPDGMGLNDMNLFEDTDGTGYVIYSNGTNTHFVISKLSSDYLSTTGTYTMPAGFVNHEAPAMFKRNGVYYIMMSGVTGWAANENYYATSTSPLGTWSPLVVPFQPSVYQDYTTSYTSQTTGVIPVAGRSDAFIYMGDRFDNTNYLGGSLYGSRHIWLPMTFDAAGNMTISWSNTWNLNTAFPTTTPPSAASGLTVTPQSSEADLAWTNNATTSYSLFVDRATDNVFTQNVVSDLVASTTTSYADTYSYSSGTTYYYRIRTLTGAGPSYSSVVSNASSPVTPSTPPSPLLASSSDSGVSNSDNVTNVTTPTIYGTASSSALITVIKNSSVLGTTTAAGNGAWTYTIPSALTPDGTYTFAVTQTVASVPSATSSALSVVVDTLVPSVSITTPANSGSLSTWSTSVSWGSASTCAYSLDSGSFVTDNCASASLALAVPSFASHTLVIRGSDTAGNNGYATSTFTYYSATGTPAISSVAVTPTTNTAGISWSTNSLSSSQINYGLSSAYGSSTSLTDTSPRVTTHSVTIPSLVPCVQYHYQLVSIDQNALVGTSTDGTFVTTGCTGNATVTSANNTAITTASGGSTSLGALSLTIPANVASSSQINFQEKVLDSTAFIASAGMPSNFNQVGTSVINLKALSDSGTVISTFARPLTVAMSYTTGQVSGLDEDSLTIYRYDGSTWSTLSNCVVDKVAKTVSCQTSHFSDFVLFGKVLAVSASPSLPVATSGGSFSGGGINYGCKDPKALNYNYFSASKPSLCIYKTISTTSQIASISTATAASASVHVSTQAYHFTRTLSLGSVGSDVLELEKYLNTHGFIIASSGVGSLGHETKTFGSKTSAALLKFQKKMGIKGANGILGPATIKFINTKQH